MGDLKEKEGTTTLRNSGRSPMESLRIAFLEFESEMKVEQALAI